MGDAVGTRAGRGRGVLACNPHNTQPWRITVAGRTATVIEVRSDPACRMPVNDPFEREHLAGLGCAVENMALAAGPTATVESFPAGSATGTVARITVPDGAVPGDGPQHIATPGSARAGRRPT